jgi:hypothetical protein
MSDPTSSEASGRSTGPFLLAITCVVAGAALLVLALDHPPQSPCEPVLGVAHALVAATMALFVVSLCLLRRQGMSAVMSGIIAVAMAVLLGYVLMTRQSAGLASQLRPVDWAYGVAGCLGVALLLQGLALRFETSTPGRAVALGALAVVAAVGWCKVMDGVPRGRTWASWDAITLASDAITAHRARDGSAPASLEAAGVADARDAWGNALVYEAQGAAWRLASLGADGEPGPDATDAVSAFADDLVVTQDGPVSWPESPCGSAALLDAMRKETPTTGAPAPPGVIDLRGTR